MRLFRTLPALGGLFFGHSRPGVFAERLEMVVAGLGAQANRHHRQCRRERAGRHEEEQDERRRVQTVLRFFPKRFTKLIDC